MTVRPIIFSGPMVRALVDGRKTQTRRLATSPLAKCEPGDRLYVREAWRLHERFSDVVRVRYQASERQSWTEQREDFPVALAQGLKDKAGYRPSIHMPRWASRLTLTVTEVRRQFLQGISRDDAIAEGITERHGFWNADHGQPPLAGCDPLGAFYCLWNSLHDTAGERWEDNPEVVALTFTVERRNVDAGAI